MNIVEFQIKHSEIIKQYQFIEHDLEGIFGLLEHGNFEELTHRVENDTMGELIRKVKFLIKENKVNYLDKNDFNILEQIRYNRNYWAHQCYLDIHEEKNKYDEIAKRLTNELKVAEDMNAKLRSIFVRI